ncbi:MAG: hypothetical protein Ta2G_02490 [Termitinemataceae bacterium]|nr:MAG: hypothetical protein Ta2G_02490 [Termitinemataceae bacterium]
MGAFECNGLKAGCGACTLSYMEYDCQIEQKHDMLRKTMLHGNIFDVLPEIQIVPSAVTEYRNRIQLHNANTPCVSVKKNIRKLSAQKIQNVSFGFMNHRGNDVVVIDDCPICDPVIRNALQNKTLKPSLDKDRWTVYGRDNLLISETCRLCGKYDFLGRQIKVSAASFFQSNGKLLEKLISDVIHVSEQADHDLICGDFYCGVGTFGVFLQEVFSSLVLFDQNKAAMQLAKENVKRCGTQFFAMDDDKFVKHSHVKGQYGFVVLDPARKGLSNLMTKWLCENKPKIICYVSCNPSALARDSKYLLQAGYTLRSLTYYDFYPHTVHIESLAVFD